MKQINRKWSNFIASEGPCIENSTRDKDIRAVLVIFLAASGCLMNILAIIAVVHSRLYQLKAFTFVLNLFISSLLMSSFSFALNIPSQLSSC